MKRILCLAIMACALWTAAPNANGAKAKKKTATTENPADKPVEKPSIKAAATDDATDAKPATDGAAKTTNEPKKADDKNDNAKKDDAKKDTPKKDSKKDAAAAAPGGPNLGFAGDFPFDRMTALSIEIDPQGMTVLTGKVLIESKDFNISCEQLKMDNKTKLVVATGSPVKMDRGATMQGHCRNLNYDMNTKSMVLENDASIIQVNPSGQRVQASADTIKVDYPPVKPGENQADAQPHVSFIMKPENNTPPEIKVLNKETATEKPKTKGATRVNENNAESILSMPAPK